MKQSLDSMEQFVELGRAHAGIMKPATQGIDQKVHFQLFDNFQMSENLAEAFAVFFK